MRRAGHQELQQSTTTIKKRTDSMVSILRKDSTYNSGKRKKAHCDITRYFIIPPMAKIFSFCSLVYNITPMVFHFFQPLAITQPCFFSFSHPWFYLFPTLGHKCYSSLGFPLYHPCLLFIPWFSLLPTPFSLPCPWFSLQKDKGHNAYFPRE